MIAWCQDVTHYELRLSALRSECNVAAFQALAPLALLETRFRVLTQLTNNQIPMSENYVNDRAARASQADHQAKRLRGRG